mgnify:CR=1 FL=1
MAADSGAHARNLSDSDGWADKKIVKGTKIFSRKAQPATEAVQFAMINPIITKKTGEYRTEESCLSLDGARACTRYEEIEVDYLDSNFKPQHGKYSGFTAQIIQHEIDHCCGVII